MIGRLGARLVVDVLVVVVDAAVGGGAISANGLGAILTSSKILARGGGG